MRNFLLLLCLTVGSAQAATPLVDGSGKLTGARDVNVDGTLYEVEFLDDSFGNVFGDASGLDATSLGEAILFGQALFDQVLLNGAAGNFDSSPELTLGCENSNSCTILVPYATDGAKLIAATIINKRTEQAFPTGDGIGDPLTDVDVNRDLSDVTTRVYADWQVQAAQADVDVLPGDEANQIFPNKGGRVPVAILSDPVFDATQVNPVTVRFGPAGAAAVETPVVSQVDGLHGPDLTLKFTVADTGILCNDTEVELTGDTYAGGEPFEGSDSIEATECESGGCHEY